MANLVYIQGLSHRGFRVKDNTGAWKMCKKGVTIQIDTDAESTKKIIAREKDNFIRVAAGNSTTASILALSRRGFRIKDSGGNVKDVKLAVGQAAAQTPITVDLTKGDTLKLLKRNKGAAWIVATSPIVSIRGLQNEQAEGFYVKRNTQATGTITSNGTNVSNGDTVTVGGKTYTFQTTLTNVDGNVHVGASAAASLTNLTNAINGSGGTPGTDYAVATTANTAVTASTTATVITLTAIEATEPGTKGNAVTLAETAATLTTSGATLSGGANAASAAPTKVFDGQTISVDIRVPHNFKALRRYHKAWVEA